MPVAKEERDDSDGDDMEQDSADSDKSSSSLDPSDSSDSDDSSGLDIIYFFCLHFKFFSILNTQLIMIRLSLSLEVVQA